MPQSYDDLLYIYNYRIHTRVKVNLPKCMSKEVITRKELIIKVCTFVNILLNGIPILNVLLKQERSNYYNMFFIYNTSYTFTDFLSIQLTYHEQCQLHDTVFISVL